MVAATRTKANLPIKTGPKTPLKKVTIYTDGACLGNPGPGGYGVVLLYGEQRKELSGGYRLTTNNRMEILAAIKGLEALKSACEVTLYSDSQYLVNAISKGWARRWQANGWKRNPREKALNPDLWEKLLKLCARHEVSFVWVRGHANNAENERCDALSKEAAARNDLEADPGYNPGIVP
jgi:ribonuclease HI